MYFKRWIIKMMNEQKIKLLTHSFYQMNISINNEEYSQKFPLVICLKGYLLFFKHTQNIKWKLIMVKWQAIITFTSTLTIYT
jgi:hypothetical protein